MSKFIENVNEVIEAEVVLLVTSRSQSSHALAGREIHGSQHRVLWVYTELLSS